MYFKGVTPTQREYSRISMTYGIILKLIILMIQLNPV